MAIKLLQDLNLLLGSAPINIPTVYHLQHPHLGRDQWPYQNLLIVIM